MVALWAARIACTYVGTGRWPLGFLKWMGREMAVKGAVMRILEGFEMECLLTVFEVCFDSSRGFDSH